MHKVAEVSLTHSRGGVSSSVDDVTDTQRCLIISCHRGHRHARRVTEVSHTPTGAALTDVLLLKAIRAAFASEWGLSSSTPAAAAAAAPQPAAAAAPAATASARVFRHVYAALTLVVCFCGVPAAPLVLAMLPVREGLLSALVALARCVLTCSAIV